MERLDFKTGTFYRGDCFEVMASLGASTVDMVLNDPPYGTTACAWDSVLPLDEMWAEYWRLLKLNGAAVLTASQPFTSALVMSDAKNFRYPWVWIKNRASGFANAKKQPMRKFEDILVFGRSPVTYNAQGIVYAPKVMRNSRSAGGAVVRNDVIESAGKGSLRTGGGEYVQEFSNYPNNILEFPLDPKTFHPTQKPVALFEYLIRTYTNPGELVLDNTAGSGTTAIAAIQSGRRWICIERDQTYFEKAVARVFEAEAGL